MLNMSGIYQIRNTVNGKCYVGSAVAFAQRWRQHTHLLRSGRHHSRILQNAWCKHGPAAFVFEPLFVCAPKDLLFYEQRAIDGLAPKYNCAKTAGSTLGLKHSDEAKANNSAAQKGKRMSAEAREKMSIAQKVRLFSATHRARISAAKKGVPATDAHKQALALARQGRRLSEAHRQAIGLASRAAWQRRKGVL